MTWETVIGLEIHVQLKTASKMFCGCSTAFGEPPNTNVCPVCLGLPGALPVPNEAAVRLGVRAALALGCTVHPTSVFARKNYFYPDLPKGYQISQFDRPLATSGLLEIAAPDGARAIRITRLHLEEDAGKSFHDRVPGMTGIDLNRCGTPLAEIVTEPDLRSPAEARSFLSALKQLLEYAAVSDCNMEEGSLRVDANLSLRRAGDAVLGVKQEVKNMNSFATVERALEQLRERQATALERGDAVALATYSAATGELRVMRSKEESHDYRYFPDPDLPPLVLEPGWIDAARADVPELPAAARDRFRRDYGLRPYDAEVLTATRTLADYFEAVVRAGAESAEAAKWAMGSVLADANERGGALRVSPERLAQLIGLVANGVLSNLAAKKVFAAVAEHDADPGAVAERLGLVQVGDAAAIERWVGEALASHPEEARRYRAGETKLLGFLIGEVMKRSGAKADPNTVREMLERRMEE